MKLKKQVKVGIVLIVLGGIGFGFYSFNHWFFEKYKTKDVNVEEKKEETNKEIQENQEKTPSIENIEKIDKNQDENPNPVQTENKKKIRVKASEVYECSEGEMLKKDECITVLATSPIRMRLPKIDPFTFEEIGYSESDPFCLDKSYTLKEDKCIKEIRTAAKKVYSCPEGFVLDGIYCQKK